MAVPKRITPAQITLLRKLTREPDYRKTFFKAPMETARATGLNESDAALLATVSPVEIDGLHRAALAVGRASPDDSCTLVYALVFALAFAAMVRDTIRE